MRSVFKWFLVRDPEKTLPSWQVILWWEIRRIPLNFLLVVLAILVYSSVVSIRSPLQSSMADRDRLAQDLAAIIFLLANILYTGGWIFELLGWPIFKQWLFRGPEKTPSWYRTILWWEIRRIPSNFIAAILGAVGYSSFIIIAPNMELLTLRAVVIAILLVNVLYTGGWILEILFRVIFRYRSTDLGPVFLGVGLVVTAFLACFPAAGLLILGIHHILFDDCFGPGCL